MNQCQKCIILNLFGHAALIHHTLSEPQVAAPIYLLIAAS